MMQPGSLKWRHGQPNELDDLLAAARRTDVVDAHVALCGLRFDQVVVTSDMDDLVRLVPSLRIHAI